MNERCFFVIAWVLALIGNAVGDGNEQAFGQTGAAQAEGQVIGNAQTKAVRVLVWDEQQPEQRQAYDGFLGEAIAKHLSQQGGFRAVSVGLHSPHQGLDDPALDATDVIVWWGHRKHDQVDPERTTAIVKRVLEGRLGLVALHSAHFADPFMQLMWERAKEQARMSVPESERASARFDFSMPLQRKLLEKDARLTPRVERIDGLYRVIPPACVFPAWRADGAASHVRRLALDHPIARGLPETWDIPQTEMYNEPFHVPAPDAVVLEERWDKGEHFRSGMTWTVGRGRVFYYRPGHETYPVYRQRENLLVLENAIRWAAPTP